jgi:hypothetical protein
VESKVVDRSLFAHDLEGAGTVPYFSRRNAAEIGASVVVRLNGR